MNIKNSFIFNQNKDTHLRYANNTTLMAESEAELKSLLLRVKGESEKAGLKLNIQKMKITASGPITHAKRWGKSRSSTDFIFLASNVTEDSECSHKLKTLAPWKKSYDKPRHHTKKQRLHSPNKNPFVKSVVFLAVM